MSEQNNPVPVWQVELTLGNTTINVLTTDRQVDSDTYEYYISPIGYLTKDKENE